MKYNGIVQRKLSLLDDQVVLLKKHLDGVSYKEFADSWMLRCMAERALQIAAEITIDISERIIALEGAGPVASATAAIDRLELIELNDGGQGRRETSFEVLSRRFELLQLLDQVHPL